LIGNAIKFKGEKIPVIKIAVKKKRSEYIFNVQDNGIGINKKDHDRIYTIF
jgi:light-regulated signal transduction histidine kinase (bacteriophytochrome)